MLKWILAIVLGLSATALATDVYVDYSVGNDGNSGLSEGAGNAKKTVAGAIAAAVETTNNIYVKNSATVVESSRWTQNTARSYTIRGYNSTITDTGVATVTLANVDYPIDLKGDDVARLVTLKQLDMTAGTSATTCVIWLENNTKSSLVMENCSISSPVTGSAGHMIYVYPHSTANADWQRTQLSLTDVDFSYTGATGSVTYCVYLRAGVATVLLDDVTLTRTNSRTSTGFLAISDGTYGNITVKNCVASTSLGAVGIQLNANEPYITGKVIFDTNTITSSSSGIALTGTGTRLGGYTFIALDNTITAVGGLGLGVGLDYCTASYVTQSTGVDTVNDTITLDSANSTWADGMMVYLESDDTMPGGLTAGSFMSGQQYYLEKSSTTIWYLHPTWASAVTHTTGGRVNITDAGSGNMQVTSGQLESKYCYITGNRVTVTSGSGHALEVGRGYVNGEVSYNLVNGSATNWGLVLKCSLMNIHHNVASGQKVCLLSAGGYNRVCHNTFAAEDGGSEGYVMSISPNQDLATSPYNVITYNILDASRGFAGTECMIFKEAGTPTYDSSHLYSIVDNNIYCFSAASGGTVYGNYLADANKNDINAIRSAWDSGTNWVDGAPLSVNDEHSQVYTQSQIGLIPASWNKIGSGSVAKPTEARRWNAIGAWGLKPGQTGVFGF